MWLVYLIVSYHNSQHKFVCLFFLIDAILILFSFPQGLWVVFETCSTQIFLFILFMQVCFHGDNAGVHFHCSSSQSFICSSTTTQINFSACCDSPEVIRSQALSRVHFYVCSYIHRDSMVFIEEKHWNPIYLWILLSDLGISVLKNAFLGNNPHPMLAQGPKYIPSSSNSSLLFLTLQQKKTYSILSWCHAVGQCWDVAPKRTWPLTLSTLLEIFSTDFWPSGKVVKKWSALVRASLLRNILNISNCTVVYQYSSL